MMFLFLRTCVGTFLLVAVAPGIVRAAEAGADSELTRPRVEILRDTWGVPHIFSETDEGALYGLGYATAEDRALQMHYNLCIIQGRVAELIGDVRIGVSRQLPEGRDSATKRDIAMRRAGYFRAAERIAASLDPETRGLLEAYSRGVNDCLRERRGNLPPLFARLGLEPEPWTPAACVASWWRLGLFFAGDGYGDLAARGAAGEGREAASPVRGERAPRRGAAPEAGRGAGPIDDAAAVIQQEDVTPEWIRRVEAYAKQHGLLRRGSPAAGEGGPRFSHAWAVGKSRTRDGSAVLVSDPQTPVRNPSLFYEYHIAGRTFDARGIGVPGSPIILIGFTRRVAWGLTALGADQADLFLLKTDAAHPDAYELDGRWVDMEVREETVLQRGGDPVRIRCRETAFGPVVTDLVRGARRGEEVALKRVPLSIRDRETVQAAFAMLRARDVREFRKALEGWLFPSANCVFADAGGDIGYATAFALPIRSPRALLDGAAAHEGWSSEWDWQGFVPSDLLPTLINPERGWIVTANHRPIASFYPLSLGNSTGGGGDTERSWRLKERLAGDEKMEAADVLDLHFDNVNPVKREIVRLGYHLRDVEKASLDEDSLKALEYLESWREAGSRMDMSTPGTEILNIVPVPFRRNVRAALTYGGGQSGLCLMLKTIARRLEKDPRAALTEEEAEYVNLILRGAWRYGISRYGEDPSAWNAKARDELRASSLGYLDTLDGLPPLDPSQGVPAPPLSTIDGGTIFSQRAQSYTQYVPLRDPDAAMAILPIGASEDPSSPFYRSGYDLWAEGKLRPAPLSREKIEPLVRSRKRL